MLSDTTAPAEELQDKLTTLEQLLLAYGRIAIGFSGGVDSSFLAAVCARIMPASTLLVHLTTPLIGTPEQASFERSVDVQASEEPHFKLPVLNLSVDQLQLPRLPATTPIAATTASAPALPPSSTTPNRWAFPPSSTAAMQAIAVTTALACARQKSSVYAPLLWRSALPRTKSASCCAHGAIRLEPAGGSLSCHARPHGRGAYAREGRFNPRLRGLPARS